MDEENTTKLQPKAIEIDIGINYFWCACGLSKDKIFCDGSHKKTTLKPLKFSISEKKTYFICTCKKTKNKPFCDGSHLKV